MNPLENPSTRRLLALVAGVVTPILNQKLSLNIPDDQVLAVLGLALAYITGSNWKEAALAKADAAATQAAGAVTPTTAAAIVTAAGAPKP